MTDENIITEISIFKQVKHKLIEIYSRKEPPEPDKYLKKIKKANEVLENENKKNRPYDSTNLPGGLVLIKHYIPTIIIPDLHARQDFFMNVLTFKDSAGYSNLQKLHLNMLQIVCLGDGFHSEGKGAKELWNAAYNEYKTSYARHKYMDLEMGKSLGLMEMVMEVKTAFPSNFYFLKGNHENILNERSCGNFPFKKYTHEGAMVVEYISRFYGNNFLSEYYKFEKNLPLLAVGKNIIISHAEPDTFIDRKSIIEYRNNGKVVKSLTWTRDGEAEHGSVSMMLKYYLEDPENAFYFSGHCPVKGLYKLRADGKLVQINNSVKNIIAVIKDNRKIKLEKDVIEVEK